VFAHKLAAVDSLTGRLSALLIAIIGSAAALSVVALLAYEPHPAIGGVLGIAFWTLVVAAASAAPVRMPGGTVVDVTIAPVVAAAVLGGPVAAVVVSIVGTIELRAIKGLLPGSSGGIPWYGMLYNQASIVIPALGAATLYSAIAGATPPFLPLSLLAVIAAGAVHFLVNNFLTAAAVGLRERRPVFSVFVGNLRQFGLALAGLTPVAWLMATVYTVAGPIGILPFALPLYTTRSGYQKVVEIREMFTQTVRSLASAVDAKDPFTAGHSVRVQTIAKDLGREMGCNEDELEALEWGGLLHDIGKIGIPDAILLKQGALTRHERIVMNGHPVKGEEILKPVAKLGPELPIIRHHHEWYNGSGYPDHLIGEEIPKLARIMHVADAYEAMTAARPYRMTPLTEEQAIGELRRYTGVQFDPVVVAAFERILSRRPDWAKPTAPPPSPRRHIPQLGEPEPQAA
jgi:putative nucleotidyltransferase with HDIG domain